MLRDFANSNKFDVNNTQEWVNFIEVFIQEFSLQSFVKEEEDGCYFYIDSQEEQQLIEDLLYMVENVEISLEYIFEGRIEYGDDYYEN